MVPDLVQIRALAEAKEDENLRFRQFVKSFECNLPPEEMDRQVAEETKRVWAGIDCTTCANCCRELNPSFSEDELTRLARRLGMTPEQVVDQYLERNEEEGDERPWRTRTNPCPFLKGSHCGVYEDRPEDCRGYPYLHEPDFSCRTLGTIERTHTCPIVHEVFERLKESWGFKR